MLSFSLAGLLTWDHHSKTHQEKQSLKIQNWLEKKDDKDQLTSVLMYVWGSGKAGRWDGMCEGWFFFSPTWSNRGGAL